MENGDNMVSHSNENLDLDTWLLDLANRYFIDVNISKGQDDFVEKWISLSDPLGNGLNISILVNTINSRETPISLVASYFEFNYEDVEYPAELLDIAEEILKGIYQFKFYPLFGFLSFYGKIKLCLEINTRQLYSVGYNDAISLFKEGKLVPKPYKILEGS